MDKKRWKKISHIIDLALSVPEPERERYVKSICTDDPELQQEIQNLLASIEGISGDTDSFEKLLQQNEALLQEIYREHSVSEQNNLAGQTIAGWYLMELIGRGGMGSVYKVKRKHSQIEQLAAIKILHQNLNTPEHLHRFRQEQQILAGLSHPCITSLIEGGITDEGTPFLVMEYVEGTELDKYCDQQKLTVKQRIGLFKTIAESIHFAHKKLIIHRDLKPENILVTEEGRIKILDFGIAKLLDPDIYHFSSIQTREEVRLMSLEYAAPEQIAGDTVSISSDIYSLGVLLCELICGVHPFDPDEKSYRAVVQSILNDEVVPPSRKYIRIENRDLYFSIAEARNTDPIRLEKLLNGDLDAIVLKSLRKEPESRYSSVGHLVDDLVRFENHRPVQARKGTFRYRFVKFAKRNQSLIIASAIFLAVITGLAGFYLHQITEQRNIARIEAEKANRIKDFTTTLFDASNPYFEENADGTVTAKELLEAGILNIETELLREPELYAEMHTVIGRALIGLGEYERAKESIEKSLETTLALYGESHTATAENMALFARLNRIQGDYESALLWMNKAHSINKALYGEESARVAGGYYNLGMIFNNSMDYDLAAENFTRALMLYQKLDEENSLSAVDTRVSLAGIQSRNGQYDEAEANLLSAAAILTEMFGENHLRLANVYSSLASNYSLQSDFTRAYNYHQMSLQLREQLLGDDHPHHIRTMSAFGLLLYRMGNYEESETVQTKALNLFEKNALTDSLDYVAITNRLALVKAATGQLNEAAELYYNALDIMKGYLEPGHSEITVVLYNLADLYFRMQRLEQARDLFEQVVKRDKKALGEDHPEVAVDLLKLAAVTRDLHAFEHAEELFSEAGTIFYEKFPPAHHRLGEFYLEYGRLKMMMSDQVQAKNFLKNSLSIFLQNFDEEHERVKEVQRYLNESLAAQ
jgi:eukaryotic-like serine/threonine-protein kinase